MNKQTGHRFPWEIVSIVVFCALMGIILVRSLGNGTRRSYVYEDVPAVVDVTWERAEDANMPQALHMTFGEKDAMSITYGDKTYEGRFFLDATSHDGARYSMKGKNAADGACTVRLQAPLSLSKGQVEGEWLISFEGSDLGRQIFGYLALQDGGQAAFLSGNSELFDMKSERLLEDAAKGTWTQEAAEGATRVSVDLGETNLTLTIVGRS